jgi:hypothetical protein
MNWCQTVPLLIAAKKISNWFGCGSVVVQGTPAMWRKTKWIVLIPLFPKRSRPAIYKLVNWLLPPCKASSPSSKMSQIKYEFWCRKMLKLMIQLPFDESSSFCGCDNKAGRWKGINLPLSGIHWTIIIQSSARTKNARSIDRERLVIANNYRSGIWLATQF